MPLEPFRCNPAERLQARIDRLDEQVCALTRLLDPASATSRDEEPPPRNLTAAQFADIVSRVCRELRNRLS